MPNGTPLTDSKEATLNLRWVTEPPIVEVTQSKALDLMREMNTNIKGWDKVAVPKSPTEDDIDQSDWKKDKRTYQERWNQRLEMTWMMLGTKFGGGFIAGDRIFAYMVDGQPIGLLSIKNGDPPSVAELVTHPGSAMAGGVLMERAVQTSDGWGAGGKLKLFRSDEDAQRAYEAMGFVGTMTMTLDPADKSEIWEKIDSKWRLKKHHGLKYVG